MANERFELRLPATLKAALKKASAKSIRSLNGEIVARLQASLKKGCP
jgi:hypothetical protein